MSLLKMTLTSLVSLAVAGCVTTQEAERVTASRYLGQTSDSFFSRYGAPSTSFPLNNGSTLYTWRGGQTAITVPAQYQTLNMGAPGIGTTETKTSTQVSHPSPSETVTKTTSRSVSMGVAMPPQILVSPARTLPIFCEAQITVDAQGLITAMRFTQDTRGEGLSLSRCAEVFGI